MAGKNTALKDLSAYSEEVRNVSVSFVDVLDSGELLTGTPTISQLSPATPLLTFANEAVSAAEKTINNRRVAAGRAVQFKVTLPEVTAETDFVILIEVATDATPPQALKKRVILTGALE